MADAKFTPGPWEARSEFIGPRLAPNSSIQVKVARVAGPDPLDEESEANAHLIAAAPDLYEAVRLFVEEYDAGDGTDGVALMLSYSNALEAAKAALAKARGEA